MISIAVPHKAVCSFVLWIELWSAWLFCDLLWGIAMRGVSDQYHHLDWHWSALIGIGQWSRESPTAIAIFSAACRTVTVTSPSEHNLTKTICYFDVQLPAMKPLLFDSYRSKLSLEHVIGANSFPQNKLPLLQSLALHQNVHQVCFYVLFIWWVSC